MLGASAVPAGQDNSETERASKPIRRPFNGNLGKLTNERCNRDQGLVFQRHDGGRFVAGCHLHGLQWKRRKAVMGELSHKLAQVYKDT